MNIQLSEFGFCTNSCIHANANGCVCVIFYFSCFYIPLSAQICRAVVVVFNSCMKSRDLTAGRQAKKDDETHIDKIHSYLCIYAIRYILRIVNMHIS